MRRVPGRSLVHVGAATVLLLAVTACGVTRGDDSRDLLMIIPNSPGGGYDQTGRAAVQVMKDDDITGGSFTVDNVVGAGGAGAMTSLIGKAGDEHTMMTVGLGVVGSTYSFGSKYQLQDATPLAQLMSEPEGILVAADSPYETLDDLVQAWSDDPARSRWAVARRRAGRTTSSPCSSPTRSASTPTTSTTCPTTAAGR